MPPEIRRAEPDPETAETVLIGPSGQSVFVIADDPEGDPVKFAWYITPDGISGLGYPIYDGEGSQIDLLPNPDYDGQTLSCTIDDGENDFVELTWLLEVL